MLLISFSLISDIRTLGNYMVIISKYKYSRKNIRHKNTKKNVYYLIVLYQSRYIISVL